MLVNGVLPNENTCSSPHANNWTPRCNLHTVSFTVVGFIIQQVDASQCNRSDAVPLLAGMALHRSPADHQVPRSNDAIECMVRLSIALCLAPTGQGDCDAVNVITVHGRVFKVSRQSLMVYCRCWLAVLHKGFKTSDILLQEAHVDATRRTVEIEGVSRKSWNGIIGILCYAL